MVDRTRFCILSRLLFLEKCCCNADNNQKDEQTKATSSDVHQLVELESFSSVDLSRQGLAVGTRLLIVRAGEQTLWSVGYFSFLKNLLESEKYYIQSMG
jgi:hypothetical protein